MRSLQARFPDVRETGLNGPPSSLLIFIAILPLVDDFCLLADTAVQLLDFMQHTQLWCQANRIEIPFASPSWLPSAKLLPNGGGMLVSRGLSGTLSPSPLLNLSTNKPLSISAPLSTQASPSWPISSSSVLAYGLLTTNLLMLDHAPGLPSALGLLPFSITSGTPRWPYTPSLTS